MKATATLGILAVAWAAACGGGSKSGAAGGETTTPGPATAEEPVAAAPATPPTGADAARAKSTFAMYPKGVQIVAGISVAQLRKSVLWPHLEKILEARGGEDLKALQDVCKMRLADVVDQAELAVDPDANPDSIVIVVDGSFDRARVEQCAKDVGAAQKVPVNVVADGSLSEIGSGSDTLWIGWPNEHTAVIGSEDRDKAWMSDRLAGKGSIREDDTLMEVLGNVDTASTAWLAFIDDTNQLAMLAGPLGGRTPTALYAWLRVTDTAKGEIAFVYGSEGDAKVAANALTSMLEQIKNDPQMGPIVSSARVGVYGANTVIELDLDKQQLEDLVTMLVKSFPI